uniref:Uncharacterized protein n=1 Tax=Opuntia streptacantha TaxID=393608 RepID=A0A7C9DQW0_OPUST
MVSLPCSAVFWHIFLAHGFFLISVVFGLLGLFCKVLDYVWPNFHTFLLTLGLMGINHVELPHHLSIIMGWLVEHQTLYILLCSEFEKLLQSLTINLLFSPSNRILYLNFG